MATDFTLFPRAGFFRRLGAWVYDALLVVAIYMFVSLLCSAFFIALYTNGVIGSGLDIAPSDYLAQSMVFKIIMNSLSFVAIVYFFVFFWSRSGQTLGMKAWRLRIQHLDGQLMSKKMGLKRMLFSLLGLGNFWLFLNWQHKLSIQDKLTETEVVVLSLEANKAKI
ncbi:RDD family protein [Thalassotalea marina]|uniref:RDD family protein n=1 Tax=Thalassotalea marina TaxID=1673741 RepID=A0A919BBL7_9GAMM|nr:RDD family protein [Thalassotalea marina]GHF77602.1 RDD family protein [Thalassotalea marina]